MNIVKRKGGFELRQIVATEPDLVITYRAECSADYIVATMLEPCRRRRERWKFSMWEWERGRLILWEHAWEWRETTRHGWKIQDKGLHFCRDHDHRWQCADDTGVEIPKQVVEIVKATFIDGIEVVRWSDTQAGKRAIARERRDRRQYR